jgi:3-phenylpropionate/trans-cinnamate dioxygenase ferredoxin subunit
MSDWITVAADADLVEGDMLQFAHGDYLIALARIGDEVHAFDDTCTHEECSLSEGRQDEDEVVCHCHGSVFNLVTGEVLLGPATEPLRTYLARVENGQVQVRLE